MDTLQFKLTTMPTHEQSTASVTSTFPSAGIASETHNIAHTKCCSTLVDTDDRPRKRTTAIIQPEWVISFVAIIILLVVIIIVLVLIVIKLAKANKVITELPSDTNYYDEIQLYGKLNKFGVIIIDL